VHLLPPSREIEWDGSGIEVTLTGDGGSASKLWRRSDDRFMTGTSGLARLVDGMLLAGAICGG
jgi:hypothetical protein